MLFPKKSLGQHFLTNPSVVAKMIAAGGVTGNDVVLEVGPGTGILTRALLETGATVVAIEADVRAIEVLETDFEDEVKEGRLQLVHDDMRMLDLVSFYSERGFTSGEFKVIANIPYYISGLLFEKVLSCSIKPSLLVYLVQKEVAERIARSEKETLLSLSVKAYGSPRYISTVVKGNFSPPPKVDSAILLVSDIPETSRNNFLEVRETDFFKMLKTGFKSKRKQLLGNLTELVERNTLEEIFSTLAIPHDVRGEDLPLSTWITLAKSVVVHTK